MPTDEKATTVPARRDPRPNEDVYSRSRRTEIEGLDPDFEYQYCNAIPTVPGQPSEVERKMAGEEFGFANLGPRDERGAPLGKFINLQWEPVQRKTVRSGRLRADDGSGTDTIQTSGGQVLMRIPKAALAKARALEAEYQDQMDRALKGESEAHGNSRMGAGVSRDMNADASAVGREALTR